MEPNKNSNGMMNGIPRKSMDNKKIGPIIGALIIILIIIISVLYFFGKKLNTNTPTDNTVNQTTTDGNVVASSTDPSTTIGTELDTQLKNVDYSF